jgi:hypothetical protein
MNRQEVVEVIAQIIDILSNHGYEDKAEWLSQRAEVLRVSTLDQDVRPTLDELHSIVLGMDGLFDLRLEEAAGRDAAAARDTLDDLADRLFELTE